MIEWLIDSARSFAALAIVVGVVVAPAIVAVVWVSRRSKQGLDWGPRSTLWSVGISLVLVFLMVFLFSYITNSGPGSDWGY